MNTETLVTSLAQILANAGIGHWSTTTPAPPGVPLIVAGAIPAAPDRAIGIRIYGQQEDVQNTTRERTVQFYIRGLPRNAFSADALADTIFATLHGLHHHAGISRITRKSALPLGADDNDRELRADNYDIILTPPPLEGTPS